MNNCCSFKEILAAASLVGGLLLPSLSGAASDTIMELRPVTATDADSLMKWNIRLSQNDIVVYRGVASFDGAGTNSSSFLYPAPSTGGFLAAVITHGFLVDSAKKEQKDQIQTTADKVLLPYKTVLDAFSLRDLMRRAAGKTLSGGNVRLIDNSADHSREMVIESIPVFSLTQDQTAIVLDNTIIIRMPANSPAASYQNTVRVISTAKEVTDPTTFWTENNGEKLKDESARLVAASLDIAFRDAANSAGSADISFQTIRYREGSTEKIERAQVLSSYCDQLLIRTLRGILMLVPTSKPVTAISFTGQCAPDFVNTALNKSNQ